MKFAESWLREWVNPDISREALSHELTMAGFEVEELLPIENSGHDDVVFDLSITPNRGDCLSVRGIAREVSAITKSQMTSLVTRTDIKSNPAFTISVENKAAADCPRYVGRVIRNIKADVSSPDWLLRRLQECGIRAINPVVDVTNYVMLELGQPMHGFDLDKINQGIVIRKSKKGEKLTLLDGTDVTLDDKTLVISDQQQPLAIAGVMGGLDSGVTSLTKNILLESAYFNPKTIARQRQQYQLNSESSYRFERGVDPFIQREAIERVSQLILDIAGGEAGKIIEEVDEACLPPAVSIVLPKAKLKRMLGIEVKSDEVEDICFRLGFEVLENEGLRSSSKVAVPEGVIDEEVLMSFIHLPKADLTNAWTVNIPSWRFDMAIPEDLAEEIARLYGYDHIPVNTLVSSLQSHVNEADIRLLSLKKALDHQGYHEIVSYSFVDKAQQALFDPEFKGIELLNPITSEMSVMRTNLWPGLVASFLYNKSRQQDRVRLFETGTCFRRQGASIAQEAKLGGLLAGNVNPEQWGVTSRQADFFDVKASVENLLSLISSEKNLFSFKKDNHPALHPGQTARIFLRENPIGIVGALHPAALEALDFSKDAKDTIFVFELELAAFLNPPAMKLREFSRFPEIRRDIAILVNQTVPSQEIRDIILGIAGDWLKDVFIFDVYQGKGVSPGLKSIALALIFQHPTRTLVDAEVTEVVNKVTAALKGQLGAELRS